MPDSSIQDSPLATRNRWPLVLVAVVLVAVVIGVWQWPRRTQRPVPVPRETVRLGLAMQATGALAIIAVQQGFLADEGLDVTVTDYVSGQRALTALLAGEVDVATTAEVPIAFESFERQDFRIVAAISSAGGLHRIVARKDRGIAQPADLRGKRVGTQRGSAVHFFLHMFLLKHGLSDEDDTTPVFLKAEELTAALVSGQIDAMSMREPYVGEAVQQLGDNAVVFAEPSIYFRSEIVAVAARYLQDKPEVMRRMIRALLQAEAFVRDKREAAAKIVTAKLKIAPSVVATDWREIEFRVALEQSLFNALEAEAHWAVNDGLVKQSTIPNFFHLVDPGPLAAIKPAVVTVIR